MAVLAAAAGGVVLLLAACAGGASPRTGLGPTFQAMDGRQAKTAPPLPSTATTLLPEPAGAAPADEEQRYIAWMGSVVFGQWLNDRLGPQLEALIAVIAESDSEEICSLRLTNADPLIELLRAQRPPAHAVALHQALGAAARSWQGMAAALYDFCHSGDPNDLAAGVEYARGLTTSFAGLRQDFDSLSGLGMPTLAPAASAPAGAVVNAAANLRAGPGSQYAWVGGVPKGEPLGVVGSNEAGDWLLLVNGAWIASDLVDDAPAVPSVTLTPEPTAEPS